MKPGSRPDRRQQRPYFQLLLWGRIHDLLTFFEAPPRPSGDEETAGVVPVKGSRMPATSASSGVHSEAEAGVPEGPCENPSSHPVEKPSHLPPGMMLHLNPLVVNHLPLAGRLKHYISNWVVISKDPWVLETVEGFRPDLLTTPHQLSVPLTVSHTKENMAFIDLKIQQMLEKEAIHVVPPGEIIKVL